MTTTYDYTATLTIVECANCHMDFGVPPFFDRERRGDHATFCCPQGHTNFYPQETDTEKLRKHLERQESRAAQLVSQLDQETSERQAAQRRVTAMKGVVTRTKKRIAAGKCVRCTCEFPDLAAHMAEAHPDYAPEEET